MALCVVKNVSANAEDTGGFTPGWEDALEEGMVTHSSISCLENSMDRGAWRATVYRATKSQTWLKTELNNRHLEKWSVCNPKPSHSLAHKMHHCILLNLDVTLEPGCDLGTWMWPWNPLQRHSPGSQCQLLRASKGNGIHHHPCSFPGVCASWAPLESFRVITPRVISVSVALLDPLNAWWSWGKIVRCHSWMRLFFSGHTAQQAGS